MKIETSFMCLQNHLDVIRHSILHDGSPRCESLRRSHGDGLGIIRSHF